MKEVVLDLRGRRTSGISTVMKDELARAASWIADRLVVEREKLGAAKVSVRLQGYPRQLQKDVADALKSLLEARGIAGGIVDMDPKAFTHVASMVLLEDGLRVGLSSHESFSGHVPNFG